MDDPVRLVLGENSAQMRRVADVAVFKIAPAHQFTVAGTEIVVYHYTVSLLGQIFARMAAYISRPARDKYFHMCS